MEEQIKKLNDTVGNFLNHSHGQILAFQYTINLLIRESSGSVKGALALIQAKIDEGIQESDEEVVKEALSIVRKEDPGLFQRLFEIGVSNPVSSAIGNFLHSWLIAIQMNLPM